MSSNSSIGVLFVCLGNICRSPSAQGIFSHHVQQAGLGELFTVDSCGTAPFNIGKSPDLRAITVTKERYDLDISRQVARQICDDDYQRFNYIIPMDRKNMMSLTAWKPEDYSGEIELFMRYHPDNLGITQIPDPYHEGIEHFYPIIETIDQASRGLLSYIREKHRL